MYYMNTNEELLGKNNFKVSKTINSKKLFKENLQEISKEALDLNPSLKAEFGHCEFKEAEECIKFFFFIIDENRSKKVPYTVPKKLKKLLKLFKGRYEIMGGVSLVDLDDKLCECSRGGDDYDDIYKLTVVKKGDISFPYVQLYSTGGDDYLTAVASILYFDADDDLNLYVPIFGNTIIVDINECIGDFLCSGNTMDYVCNLADRVGIDEELDTFLGDTLEDIDEQDIEDLRFLEAYRQKYGIVKVRHNRDYMFDNEGDAFISYILVSKRRIKEDIISNIC